MADSFSARAENGPASRPFHVVLHQPEIPQNTGNIGRTCVALNAKLWLVRPLGFQLDEARLRRAGLDYWEHLHWEAVSDWNELLAQLPTARFWYFSRKATRPIYDVKFEAEDVLVFGSETQGLPESLLAANPERCLTLPMSGPVRSLNLACAAGVAMYEAYRQLFHAAEDIDSLPDNHKE